MNYLYNGVLLPALPEWDKTTYPYALIRTPPGFSDLRQLIIFTDPVIVFRKGYVAGGFADGEAKILYFLLENGEWVKQSEGTANDYTAFGEIWSNHDIINADDNTVYFATTTPISLANQTVIEWDGNTTDLQSTTRSYTYSDGTVITNTYYKVSDVVPSKKQALGGYHVTEYSGVLVTSENTDEMELVDGDICAGAGWLVTESGVWLYSNGTDYTNLFTYLTAAPDIDPVAWWTGYRLGQIARGRLRK